MKKIFALMLSVTMLGTVLMGCSSDDTTTNDTANNTANSTQSDSTTTSGRITVISREDGSGTRGAFTEITGVDDGNEDRTTIEANIQDGTGKVMVEVANNPQAIGYISLGSLNDTVKALEIDDVYPTMDTILDGSYAVARPFNIAVSKTDALDPIAEELLSFIFSQEGQDIVAQEGFVPVAVTTETFESSTPSGTITIGGSTSVNPLMEVLVEEYKEINPNANINIEGVGSSAGMNGAIDGTFDIGMASRNMKDSELEVLAGYACAMDGIAIIVNNTNSFKNLTMEQLMNIYIGEIANYDDLA